MATEALSSGEAEFYASVKGTSSGLSTVAILSDMGLSEGTYATRVRIINLRDSDSYAPVSPSFMSTNAREVFVEDNTGTPTGYGAGSLDPDPLYLGALDATVVEIPIFPQE